MTFGRGGSVRAFSAIVLVAGLAFLSACGGSGTPVGVPITISLSATLTSVNPGQATTITATVANDSTNKGVSWAASPSGFGALSNATSTSVTYTAPISVPTATQVTITATSLASSSVTATIQISVQSSAISIFLSIPPSSSPTAPQTINQGQQLSVNATLTNDTSSKGVTWSLSPPSGAGTLSNPTSKAVTYIAPGGVASNTPVTLTATSVADSNATAQLEITVFPSGAGPNVAALNVNSGPVPATSPTNNLAYVSVTICVPGTTTCETVDDIQVDTGSAGLRILQSAMPAISLPTVGDANIPGNDIFNCVQFADTSYLWGPMQQADIKIGSEVASAALIQTVSTSSSGIPTACSNGNTTPGDENTPTALGANGILGIGLEQTDCEIQGQINLCDNSVQAPAPAYFSCPSSGCSLTDAPIALLANNQVVNPVVLFGSDSNGVVVDLPAVLPPEFVAPTLSGALIFGINTATNNAIPSNATGFVLTNDSFTTSYGGQTLTASVIDSGSSALFFPSSSLAPCPAGGNFSGFYCPGGQTPQTATNGGVSIVNFTVDDAGNLFTNNPNDAVFGTLAGQNGNPGTCNQGAGSCTFDWGLPFFYGRPVFTAIDGQTVNGVGPGPFWAY